MFDDSIDHQLMENLIGDECYLFLCYSDIFSFENSQANPCYYA